MEGRTSSKRLHIRDRVTGQMFLVDTGQIFRCFPLFAKLAASQARLDYSPRTIPESIHTVSHNRSLDLGLKRPLRWNFTIAAVPYAIIGADLLSHYGLLVDLRRRVLVDSLTGLYIHATIKRVEFTSTSSVDHASTYSNLLKQFPEITGNSRVSPPTKGDVYHYIDSSGFQTTAAFKPG